MNPFDYTGPQFLLFYLVLSALTIAGLVLLRRNHESSKLSKIDLSDPYLIAYLRGGCPEMLRVAVFNLIDRGLLLVNGTSITAAQNASWNSVRKPVERELLKKFKKVDEASSVFNDANLSASCASYEQTLKNAGLLPNASIKIARLTRLLVACFLLGGVGVAKILIAFERGRTNVGFLIVLIIVAIFFAIKVSFPPLTDSGKAIIADLKNLYSDLKQRALFLQPGGATIEPLMLAAVYGVGALEGAGFSYVPVLFPRAVPATASTSSSTSGKACGSTYDGWYGTSWGASSSSSCGSSGGSSCGGGGCGGGCGGCGS